MFVSLDSADEEEVLDEYCEKEEDSFGICGSDISYDDTFLNVFSVCG